METSLPTQQTDQEHKASRSQSSSDRRAPEERFALAIHGASDGWWDRDLRTNTVYLSPRWKQLLGYAEHDIPHRFEEWTERVHPDDLERVMIMLQQQMDGHVETYEIDHRVRHKDGTYHWIRARGSAHDLAALYRGDGASLARGLCPHLDAQAWRGGPGVAGERWEVYPSQ